MAAEGARKMAAEAAYQIARMPVPGARREAIREIAGHGKDAKRLAAEVQRILDLRDARAAVVTAAPVPASARLEETLLRRAQAAVAEAGLEVAGHGPVRMLAHGGPGLLVLVTATWVERPTTSLTVFRSATWLVGLAAGRVERVRDHCRSLAEVAA